MSKKLELINKTSAQVLISRLPYSKEYDLSSILESIKKVDSRGIIALSVPIHTEYPGNAMKLILALQESGLHLVSLVSWHRDRHIVTTRSKRLTNAWEPIAIFSRSDEWFIDRDGPARPKRGVSGREEQFDEDDFYTCIGDFWPIRSDKRDRRLLPAQVILNVIQLAGLAKGDTVLDPWGNPTVKEQCTLLGLKYVDDNLPSQLRDDWKKKKHKKTEEDEGDL